MRAHFRSLWLGVFLLAAVASVTSCKKQKEVALEKTAEPWPVAAVLEWGFWEDDNGPAIVLYSDRRLIVKRLPADELGIVGPSYWTRVLSPDEFSRIEEASGLTLRTSSLMDSYEFGGPICDFGTASCLYFGLPGKGMTMRIDDLLLTSLTQQLSSEVALRKDANCLPQNLWEYCKQLVAMTRGDFEPWRPDALTIEFYTEPSEQTRGEHWPDEWPKPEFPTPVTINKRAYVKLDANRLSLVQKLLGGKPPGESSLVDIAGKQYAAEYRFYFPGEENWRESFPRFAVMDIETDEIPVSRSAYSSPSKPKHAFAR